MDYYQCRKKGNIARYCPRRINRTNITALEIEIDLVTGKLNGWSCKNMRLDTGADKTMRRNNMDRRAITTKIVSFKPSEGPVHYLSLA